MFGLFKKKNQGSKKLYPGKEFGPFIFAIPEDWNCIIDNGTLRANKGDVIRLNISMRDMTEESRYSLESLFETIKSGYLESDINWGVHSHIAQKGDYIYQTMEYLDDPRLILAVVEKIVTDRKLVVIISFAGNSEKDVKSNFDTFKNLLEKVELV